MKKATATSQGRRRCTELSGCSVVAAIVSAVCPCVDAGAIPFSAALLPARLAVLQEADLQRRSFIGGFVASAFSLRAVPSWAQGDPLPSWNDGPAKQSIVDFVTRTTTIGSRDWVPVPERIATFDNDGTLWTEQPMYFQMIFALDRIKAMASRHPEWRTTEPFRSVLADDRAQLAALGEKAMVDIVAASHAGLTTEQFRQTVIDWMAMARHPRFNRPYTDLVFQPMLELLALLRANQFKTFIVSGGGSEFMRPWTERVYGIPPEQVVGSSGVTKYVMAQPDKPVLMKEAKAEFIDDGPGKPVGINHFIGRRPYFAFGNSDGDQQMLEWTAAGEGLRYMGLVHHTDAVREYAYDRDSPVGRLDKAWDEAVRRKWTVVSMKDDWKVIYPFELR
ncbi:MAG: haloacid dehalogenase-like hydrolase [Rhodospirillales bacterium]|nr:haloacid dehalogenase-like hydrolase [Rhodospirillales bacterium]